MSELSFLISLLLDYKLPKTVQGVIKERIKEVEKGHGPIAVRMSSGVPASLAGQSPSTIANMLKDPGSPIIVPTTYQPQEPIAPAVAVTPMAAQALEQRSSVIKQAMTGKNEPGRTSPRKF